MSYKIHYFPLPGRAEVARLCLTLGEVPFEDVHLTRDTFPEFKAKTPFGQVPVLELPDGRMLAQSGAIDRYTAKLGGLYPEDPLEAAWADQAVFQMSDTFELFTPTYAIADLDARIKARQDLMAGKARDKMLALQKLLEPLQESGKYVAGSKLSYADLSIFAALSTLRSGFLDGISKTVLDEYPVLKAYRDRIASEPAIKAYYEKYTEGPRSFFRPDAAQ